MIVFLEDRDLTVAWIEPPCVSETETARCRDIKTEAEVVICGGADIETIGSMGGPRCTHGRVIVNEGLSSKGSERRFGKIEWVV